MEGGDNNEKALLKALEVAASRPWEVPEYASPSSWRCWQAAYRVPYVMLCKNPFVKKAGEAYGCGQCLPCRITRRRVWTHRIILEAAQYADNTFATLTYTDDHYPKDGSLKPEHLRNFIKKLRFNISPEKLRFFAVGEYGDTTNRAHYHAALFGFPNCQWTQTRKFRHPDRTCCPVCELVRRSWGLGHIMLGTLEPHSAAYIAGYVTKKMTNHDDERLDGRHPEFARMSLKPGIGGDALHEVASATLEFLDAHPDVPSALDHGGKTLPLGRYLTRRLRALTGRPLNAPPQTIAKQEAKLHHLRETAETLKEYESRSRFKAKLMEELHPKIKALEQRQRVYRKRRTSI